MQFELQGPPPGYDQGYLLTTIPVQGDRAVYTNNEFGQCTIGLQLAGTRLKVTGGRGGECGFGNRAIAEGSYTRTKARPKITPQP